MNRYIHMISDRLSLRPPQQRALEILDHITEMIPLTKQANVADILTNIKNDYSSVSDFERDFPSLCFSLATGVGKTRLMGAFISYLHLKHGINNFFILAPNLTIYKKLITDFSDQNNPKYVFKGISEFALNPPRIVTGDNYENHDPLSGTLFNSIKINIFNISKISSEVRGGKAPRIKRLCEYIGQSYFDELASLSDLVLLMDESHRYRASAGLKAINELKPILVLELTATPFTETNKGTISFKNVIYDYPLGKAIADGFVKKPAVVTRKDFNPRDISAEELERIKLEDGVRLHESVKVELETYAREFDKPFIKPFLLVIAKDTTHASQLLQFIQSSNFFEGRYQTKVIQVDSSKTGTDEEQMIYRLLKVESSEEPTEIVIHVNMLKEGWDVTNLYTIVPLRAANARVLIEQSIGRGLRLPYGKLTGVSAVDRLNIIGHDKFQEIIDEANKPGSMVQLQGVELDIDELGQKVSTVISQSQLATKLGIIPPQLTNNTFLAGQNEKAEFANSDEQMVARLAYDVISKYEDHPQKITTIESLNNPETLATIAKKVEVQYQLSQHLFENVDRKPDISNIVAQTLDLVLKQTINIPRILVVPKGEVKSGFKSFTLNLDRLKYPAISDELWVQHLQSNKVEVITLGDGGIDEDRLENYVVSGLVDFNDISYEGNADLLYDLATQTINHFRTYLPEEEIRKVLRCYQRDIARFIHAQMSEHFWEEVTGYEVIASKDFTPLKDSAYTHNMNQPFLDYRISPEDKSNMAKYIFGGFSRCLYHIQKFDSDSERRMAVILERDSNKWFKPYRGLFQIFYSNNADHLEYQPDFIAETNNIIYMIEVKMRKELDDAIVTAKKDAATKWCVYATDHAKTYGGKPWKYLLLPHDQLSENVTLSALDNKFSI